MLTLYQFSFSHFCEKVRWALDYKHQSYRVVNLLPGFHVVSTRRIAPNSAVPILLNGSNVVQNSSDIITFLDQHIPAYPLTPACPTQSQAALAWESYLDAEIGVTLRQWFYFHALPKRQWALHFLTRDMPWHRRALFGACFPIVRTKMIQLMQITPATAKAAEQRLLTALDKLDLHLLTGRQFLVDDQFSRADLTACALLSPLCINHEPAAVQAQFLPDSVQVLRQQHQSRPYFMWVQKMYQNYRLPQANLTQHRAV